MSSQRKLEIIFNFIKKLQMNDPNRNDDDNAEGDTSTTSDKGNALLEEFRQQWKKELKTDEFVAVKSNDVKSSQKIDEDKVNAGTSI